MVIKMLALALVQLPGLLAAYRLGRMAGVEACRRSPVELLWDWTGEGRRSR